MFKFGFCDEDERTDEMNDASTDILQWLPATEIFSNEGHFETVKKLAHTSSFSCSNMSISYIPGEKVINETTTEDSVVEAERLHSDLLPAKYEGGFKIWECTKDLVEFLVSDAADVQFSGKRVLDLGCGAGMLGLIALERGATVHFQDYNASVLNTLTIPNILLNMNADSWQKTLTSCRFFAGDWGSLVDLLTAEDLQYDLILTSETIYNVENYPKLCAVFKKLLSSGGVVFVAAKTYYFGVGGGMRQFEAALKADGVFTSSVCWKCTKGLQREILRITFSSNNI